MLLHGPRTHAKYLNLLVHGIMIVIISIKHCSIWFFSGECGSTWTSQGTFTDEAKQTPKAVPNIAKEEKHIEKPPVDAQEAPVKEHEQLAPPGVNIDTKSNSKEDAPVAPAPVAEDDSKVEQAPSNDDIIEEQVEEIANEPIVEKIEKPVLDDIPNTIKLMISIKRLLKKNWLILQYNQ